MNRIMLLTTELCTQTDYVSGQEEEVQPEKETRKKCGQDQKKEETMV